MRKAAILIGIGAFCVTMALLLKFYAYDKLAVVPYDQNTRQLVVDDSATFFDADNVRPGSGKLTTTVTVIGDPDESERASEQTGRNVAVMSKGQVSDNNGEAPPMDASRQTFAIDRTTGEAVPWEGNSQNGQAKDFQKGLMIKFPFQTQKQTYNYYDGTIGKPMQMKYVGEETVKGLDTYKFQGTVPMTKFRTQDVPRGIFGLEDTGGVDADRLYANDRTIWVEPETGVMIKVVENQRQELRWNEPGARTVNALTTDSVMTDDTVQANVDEYATKAMLLKILRFWAPLLLGIIGIGLLLAGLALSLKARGNRRDDEDDYDDTTVYDDDQDRTADGLFRDREDAPVAGGRVERRQGDGAP